MDDLNEIFGAKWGSENYDPGVALGVINFESDFSTAKYGRTLRMTLLVRALVGLAMVALSGVPWTNTGEQGTFSERADLSYGKCRFHNSNLLNLNVSNHFVW